MLTEKSETAFSLIAADQFTLAELTEIYNETRTDYVVPMPMNEAKMREYIENYDVDLAQSVVAHGDKHAYGLGMLGVRRDQTWITRLGVTPWGRRKRAGQRMMEAMLANSVKICAQTSILEVIKDNAPAHRLFQKMGFETQRELLVIRRPPIPIDDQEVDQSSIKEIDELASLALLEKRTDLPPSWVSDTQSMQNAGGLRGLVADVPDLGQGWLVYQDTPFQLSRIVIETAPDASLEVAFKLLTALHKLHPRKDTMLENLSADDKHWPVFEALGYMVAFTRIEMYLQLQQISLCKKQIKPELRVPALVEA